jgi:FAD synthase
MLLYIVLICIYSFNYIYKQKIDLNIYLLFISPHNLIKQIEMLQYPSSSETYCYDGENITDCINMYDTNSYKKRNQDDYYIGVYDITTFEGNTELILELSVTPKTLFNFKYNDIVEYCNDYRINGNDCDYTTVEILKLDINKDVYNVIVKTHWLRLIQRKWKKVFAERCRIREGRKAIKSLNYREFKGCWIRGFNYLPGLNGMLSNLK